MTPMSEQLKITKLRHLLRTKAGCFHCESDLVFIDDKPAVVLEWRDYSSAATIPLVSVPLDPRYLHPVTGWGEVTHLYDCEILDPRD